MNDLMTVLNQADPAAGVSIENLDGTDLELLEQILATPSGQSSTRPGRSRFLVTVAAAAAVAAAIAVPVWHERGAGSHGRHVAGVPALARDYPRLLIDEPGWTVTHANGFDDANGTIEYEKGDRSIELSWYPASAYESYWTDRLDVSAPETVTLDGRDAALFRYSAHDFAVMGKPDGAAFVELRTSTNWTKAEFLATLAKVKQVDVDTWLASMPSTIIVPGEEAQVIDQILADVPVPPGVDRDGFRVSGVNDRYQVGARVIEKVTCGWIKSWKGAAAAGDAVGVQRAKAALGSARGWQVLKDMDLEGDYSEGPWQLADEIKAGTVTLVRAQESQGCL